MKEREERLLEYKKRREKRQAKGSSKLNSESRVSEQERPRRSGAEKSRVEKSGAEKDSTEKNAMVRSAPRKNLPAKRTTKKKRRYNKKAVMIAASIAIAIALIGGGVTWYLNDYVNQFAENEIAKGIYIGDKSIGNMTEEEALAVIDEIVLENQTTSLTLLTAEPVVSEFVVPLSTLGFKQTNGEKILKEAVEYGKKGNIFSRYQELKNLEEKKYVLDLEYALDSEAIETYIVTTYAEVQTQPVNASITIENGVIVHNGGDHGMVVDIPNATKLIEEFVVENYTQEGQSITLPVTTQAPEITSESLATITDELGSYKTQASTSGGRYKNLLRATELLNGKILQPGETISVAQSTQPYTADNGYYQANSYSSGEVVQSYAGGICQISSTMYNAILLAELEVDQRQAHSMTVSYVPEGRDAAIAGDYKDLKFTNNYETPIYIHASVSSGNVVMTIYGQDKRAENREVKYESKVISVADPAAPKFKANSSSAIGSKTKVSSGFTGKTAELWKYEYVDGAEVSKSKVNTSYYNASGATYSVGTKSSYPEATALVVAAINSGDEGKIDSAIAQAKALIAEKEAPPEPEPEPNPEPETEQTPDSSTDGSTASED